MTCLCWRDLIDGLRPSFGSKDMNMLYLGQLIL